MLLRYKYTTFRHKARLQFCYFLQLPPALFLSFSDDRLTAAPHNESSGSLRRLRPRCSGSLREFRPRCRGSLRGLRSRCRGIALQILARTPVDQMRRLFRLHRCRVGHLYTEEIIPLTALLALPSRCFGFVHDENLVSAFTIQNCHYTSCFPAVVFLLSV